jgi:hypothetical protein
MFIQRTAGSYIRKRLRSFGIDLNDQTINQRLARDAVKMGLATIDLSSASDSISVELVRKCLPDDWFSFLDDIRVKSVEIDGSIHQTSMFSSMGNGFTFELESLLFWCITRAVAFFSKVKGKISVYGDDIIAPSRIVPRLIRLFSYLGFKINTKKTFWRGPFRESCGKHYHTFVDVTPFYLRKSIGCKTDIIRVLNQLLKWDSEALDTLTGVPKFTTRSIADFHSKWIKVLPACLHGGQDLDSISSLVTGDRPRGRLLQKSKQQDFSHLGGLRYWLTTRETASQLTCDPSVPGRYYVTHQVPWLKSTTWDPYDYV